MKAARLHRYDDSIPQDSLTIEEIDEPRIEGPLDVIVRIGAAGLCRTGRSPLPRRRQTSPSTR